MSEKINTTEILEKPVIQKHMILNSLHLQQEAYKYLQDIIAHDNGIIETGHATCIFVDKTPCRIIIDISYVKDLPTILENCSNIPISVKNCLLYANNFNCTHVDFIENADGKNTNYLMKDLSIYKGKRKQKNLFF